MKVVVLSSDLMIGVRITDAAERAGLAAVRVDAPAQLPAAAGVGILFVDWGERAPDWSESLARWRATAHPATRVILFGSHLDLEAHRDATRSGFGPMWARSKLVADLPKLFSD